MFVQNIEALSQAGCQFYRSAIAQVTDYNIRRLFQQRYEIYRQLREVVTLNQTPTELDAPQLKTVIHWFKSARSSTQCYDTLIFLDLLEAQESVVLKTLKKFVKTVPKTLSNQLAQLAASFQVNHDELEALKVQYRYQQGPSSSFQS